MKKLTLITLITLIIPARLAATLSDDTLKNKNEGYYFTGLPLVNYTTDDGLGYGARVYLYNNGMRNDKFFAESPYLMQLYAQFYTTTEGYSYHELNLDMYSIAGTKFRVKSALAYEKRTNANYYGQGEGIKSLTDASGREYDTYSQYESDFLKKNNYRNFLYNKYSYTMPKYWMKLVGEMIRSISLITGFEINKVAIESWDGRKFTGADGHRYNSGPTLLDITRGSITGYDGGWTNAVKAGIVYDTRDYPPDPSTGFYIDYTFHAVSRYTGSDFNYHRSTMGARRYVEIFKPLVLALRVSYTDTSKGTPFYDMPHFEFLEDTVNGLGGNRTLRGFPMNRFVGETMAMANAELRLRMGEVTPGGERFTFKMIAFADTGNIYDRAADPFRNPGFSQYKTCWGGGLVVVWNLATVIHFYYGVSRETTQISIDFNHSI